MSSRVLVIGAGPKAAALIARARAFWALEREHPEILIIDSLGPAANWNGENGFTSGDHRLGTPPEKDVGFPYNEKDREVAEYLFSEFSWSAFLLHDSPNKYSEWIDRGRPHPWHRDWARYLNWVIAKASGDGIGEFVRGEVSKATPVSGGWELSIDGQPQPVTGDGLVITGPGVVKRIKVENPGDIAAQRRNLLLDGRDFWVRLNELDGLVLANSREEKQDESFCVIGSGETAASVVVEIVTRYSGCPVLVVNRQGTIFSRGEGFHENRLFTEPEGDGNARWSEISTQAKRELIRRTDRGVFSVDTVKIVNWASDVTHRSAEVDRIRLRTVGNNQPDEFQISGSLTVDAGNPIRALISARHVVDATGFDPWWFTVLLPPGIAETMKSKSERDAIEAAIDDDLSVPPGLIGGSRLHVPMLAALAQGPGFPNLSCLGSVARRIFERYVPAASSSSSPAVGGPIGIV